MAAKPKAAPSRAALNADRTRVYMVNSSPATVKRPRGEQGCRLRQLPRARLFAGAECELQAHCLPVRVRFWRDRYAHNRVAVYRCCESDRRLQSDPQCETSTAWLDRLPSSSGRRSRKPGGSSSKPREHLRPRRPNESSIPTNAFIPYNLGTCISV